MKSAKILATLAASLFLAASAPAQDATNQSGATEARAAAATVSEAAVPPLIKFNGMLLDADSKPISHTVGITFALYARETGGSALWVETQNVHPDANGNYAVFLGAQTANGLPADVFSTGEAHWLGLQIENHPEQQRVLLVSVPYALKAHDAETLGGLPPSAFLPAASASTATAPAPSAAKPNSASGPTNLPAACAFSSTGTLNFIPIWTGACSQGNSLLFQTGGKIGLNNAAPAAQLDVLAPSTQATGLQSVTSSTAFFAAAMFGHATGKTGVTRGVYGVADSPTGIGVHGIAAIGGQFETGTSTGDILVGRGLGSTRLTVDPLGNTHTTGSLRVDAGISAQSTATAGAAAISGHTAAAAIPGTGVLGTAGIDGTGVSGTATVSSCGSIEICSATGVSGTATGSSFPVGVSGFATGPTSIGVSGGSDLNVGVQGSASATTGNTIGVSGSVKSPSGIGTEGSGPNTGVQGVATSTAFFAAGVFGHSTATSGVTRGVYGVSDSSGGIGVHGIAVTGGQFETGSGNEIIGRGLGHTNFRVDDTGKVFADGGFQASGADFAESFAIRGDRDRYEPGDLLIIDRSATRRMALASKPYSKLVAGIYSTKPGLLGTVHAMFDSEIEREVPLAVVGVVPCKVTAENGPIAPGDLLVSSSTPGFAMKGTNRKKMLGAVVGKALEPLPSGTGVITILVTLQ